MPSKMLTTHIAVQDIERYNLTMRTERPAAAGATTMQLRTIPEGLVGETVYVDPKGNNETVVISAVTERTIAFIPALANAYPEDTVIFRPSILSMSGSGITALTNMVIGFIISGTLGVASGVIRMHAPKGGTIKNVTATVNTAPTGASIIVDIHKNGTTIFTNQANRPTILAGQQNDLASTPDVTTFVQNDVFTMDVDQVGSVVAGANLVVQVRYDAP